MRIVMFYHSLLSDWNHGNAHFLRGVASELISRGHNVQVYEPRNAWSLANLEAEYGPDVIKGFRAVYPALDSIRYDTASLDLDSVLQNADIVIVHEWNDPELVSRIGEHRAGVGGYRLFFHDTHHRSITDPDSMEDYDLANYDGVLAFGGVIRDVYLQSGWVKRAWVWHEAADVRVFKPIGDVDCIGDLVWIGNWGDNERSHEIREFLIEPVKVMGLKARVYGVRYPEEAIEALADAGIEYGGWLPNYRVPEVFAQFRVTIHIPRRPYVHSLQGIPTIRPFEALACGIPLICSPWNDVEGLFSQDRDFFIAHNGDEMRRYLRMVLEDDEITRRLVLHGRRTILERHTCAHRVDQLLDIYNSLKSDVRTAI